MFHSVQKRVSCAPEMSAATFTGTIKLHSFSGHAEKMWRTHMSVLPEFLSFHPKRNLMDPRDNTTSYFLGENSFQEKREFVFEITPWHFGAGWE